MEKPAIKNPYEHTCADGGPWAAGCPACIWTKQYETTGDTRMSSIPIRKAPGAKELKARLYGRLP